MTCEYKFTNFKDIKTDVAVSVDVGVIARCTELDGGCSVGIPGGEREGQLVLLSLVHCSRAPSDGSHPVE